MSRGKGAISSLQCRATHWEVNQTIIDLCFSVVSYSLCLRLAVWPLYVVWCDVHWMQLCCTVTCTAYGYETLPRACWCDSVGGRAAACRSVRSVVASWHRVDGFHR